MKKKTFALLLVLVLLAGGLIGGTIAWLTDDTDPVVNTFTTSDIDITLAETTGADYKMVPGLAIKKNPRATVLAGSEPCWLFVRLKESDNFDDFMTYTVAAGWTELPGFLGVYYRKVLAADIGTAYGVLDGDAVIVKSTVTKEMMDALTPETYPTLTVTAFASQLYKSHGVEFTPAEAWDIISP